MEENILNNAKYEVFMVFERFSGTLRVGVRSRENPGRLVQRSRQVLPDECRAGYQAIAEEMAKECEKELENG